MQNLVSQRGLNDQKNQRIQDQLVLEQTQLSRMLGPTVISDVAMIGSDVLMQDGAAIGFLFEARNSYLLGNSLSGPRSARVKAGKAKEETVKIAGQNVSLLASPDGRIRSYYVVSGDYHFITSSRTLVERFLKVAKGEGSLGTSREFRHARSVLPLDRKDAVFIYFSDAFLPQLCQPGLSHRVSAATGSGDGYRNCAACQAQRGRRGEAGRLDRRSDRRRVPAARLRPAGGRQPRGNRQG